MADEELVPNLTPTQRFLYEACIHTNKTIEISGKDDIIIKQEKLSGNALEWSVGNMSGPVVQIRRKQILKQIFHHSIESFIVLLKFKL